MKTILGKLVHFEVWADYNKFGQIWKGDQRMAEHLWEKFTGYNHSILRLWCAMDLENRKILSDYLEKNLRKEKKL